MAEADDALPELSEEEQQAIEVLREEAGTAPTRARHLVSALQTAYTREGLGILLGKWPVSGGVVDQRVARLDALLDALDADEAPPTPFELGAMLKITPTQAQTLLRTYQARFGAKLRARMRTKIAAARSRAVGDNYEIEFDDKPSLDFAVDMLRRQGFARGLEVDTVNLKLKVPAELRDPEGRNAAQLLTGGT